MYTAPFRFSKISPQTFLFFKNAYSISWILFWVLIISFFTAMWVNIPGLIEKLIFVPYILGAVVAVYIIIPIIFVFFGFRNKMEMTIEGDKILFLDKNTKEVLSQNSIQNIKNVSFYYLQYRKYSGGVYTFLLEDHICGLQPFVMSSGTQRVVSRNLSEFEVQLNKNGVNTQGIQDFFIRNKKYTKIIIGALVALSLILWIYRFSF